METPKCGDWSQLKSKCSISTDMTIWLKKWRQRHSLQGSEVAEREAALLGLHLNHKQIRADLQGTASSYCMWPLTSARSTLGILYLISPTTTNFLKHDALLLHWHSFAMSRYLHPEDCNLLFFALSTEPRLSSLFHSSVCSLRLD